MAGPNTSMQEESWMQDSYLPVGWMMLLQPEGASEARATFRAPDGKVVVSRPQAIKYMTSLAPVLPRVLERVRRGLMDEGWKEAEHLPEGWMQRPKDDSHHAYLTQNFDMLKSVKNAVSFMQLKRYNNAVIDMFWQNAPLPTKRKREEDEGEKLEEKRRSPDVLCAPFEFKERQKIAERVDSILNKYKNVSLNEKKIEFKEAKQREMKVMEQSEVTSDHLDDENDDITDENDDILDENDDITQEEEEMLKSKALEDEKLLVEETDLPSIEDSSIPRMPEEEKGIKASFNVEVAEISDNEESSDDSSDDTSENEDEDKTEAKSAKEFKVEEDVTTEPEPRSPSPMCGYCSGCKLEEDCGCCRACADSPKFGGPGRLGGPIKCSSRRCTEQGKAPRRVTMVELEREKERIKIKTEEEQGLGDITIADAYSVKESHWKEAQKQKNSDEIEFRGKRYSCDQCEWFGGASGLFYHQKSKHYGVKYDCTYCEFSTQRAEYLGPHILAKHYDQVTELVRQTNGSDLEETELFEAIRYRVELEITRLRAQMKEHKFQKDKYELKTEVQPEDKPEYNVFDCKECEWSGKTGNGLRYHRRTAHEGLKSGNYWCMYCEFKSTSAYYHHKHVQNEHPGDPSTLTPKPNYERDLQLKQYKPRKQYKTRDRQGKHACKLCEWSGNSQSGLMYHKQTIHDKKFLYCEYCDYKTSRGNVLVDHMARYHADKMIREIPLEPPIHDNNLRFTNMKNVTAEEKSNVEAETTEDDVDPSLPPLWSEEGGLLVFSPPGVEGRTFHSRREAVLWLVGRLVSYS